MSNSNGSINGQFGSKLGFILASVGSAVGMGNIWMFPYRVGQYGGATFLLIYFFFVALFGWVGLSGEFAFGRLTGTGPIGSYDYAMKSKGKNGGKILGAIPLFGSLGIAIGYAIIVGWVLRFAVGSGTGAMMAKDSTVYFSEITGAFGSIPWHLCVVLMTIIFLIGGVTKGIEKINKFMMPAFFVLFVIIAIRVAFLPGAIEGYKYLLIPKWEYVLNPETWIMAMGQAFFSLSITGSGMIISVSQKSISNGDFFERVEKIAKAQPDFFILREKDINIDEYNTLAKKCFEICKKYNTKLSINTNIQSAIEIGIKNIHLPFSLFCEKRNELNYFENIGVSVHSKEEAIKAEELNATYIIAGHIYNTDCKKGIEGRGLKYLEEICNNVSIPVYGIGGISIEKIPEVIKTGAYGVAVMSEFMKCENPYEKIIEYKNILNKNSNKI